MSKHVHVVPQASLPTVTNRWRACQWTGLPAVEPMTGESFHQIIPFTTQPAFEVFVSEFAKVYRDQKIVKIKDGAPWHRIQSPEPAIELSTLPADLPTGKPVSEPAYSHLS